MKEKLYRFTLAFDGEPQDVGVLQGLNDTPIESSVSEEFYEQFKDLPCPLLETPDDSPVECWFREKGLLKFRDVLNEIIYELSCVNWQVLGQVIDEDVESALYVDDFQVAYASTYLETDKTKFKEVGSIQDTVPYISYLSKGEDYMKKEDYTKEALLGVLSSYHRMIERTGSEFPTVVLGDIKKSIESVLRTNEYNKDTPEYSFGFGSDYNVQTMFAIKEEHVIPSLEQENNIGMIAYQKYKTDWLQRRNYKEDVFDELRAEYEQMDPEFRENNDFEDYINEYGIHGEIYVCFDEFLDNEYQDEEYMKELLTDAEYKEYLSDRETDLESPSFSEQSEGSTCTTRELLESKGLLGLWKVSNGEESVYRITDDGCGYCNSIEEMSSYYNKGTEIDLVKEIINKGNKVLFENNRTGEEVSCDEYMEQFNSADDFPIMPYVNFESYEKVKEIWDLLSLEREVKSSLSDQIEAAANRVNIKQENVSKNKEPELS